MNTYLGTAGVIGLLLVGAGCPKSVTLQGTGDTASKVAAPVTAEQDRKTLDLSGKGLTAVPADIFDKTDLQELNLSNNRLTGALQSQVQRLQKLIVLDLSRNEFTGVPAEVGQLQELQVLDLHQNKLTGLPQEIGNLPNLRIMDIRGNKISRQDLDAIRVKAPLLEVIE